MSQALQLLMPCCSSRPTGVAFKEDRFSSALSHLIVSLAVAIILGLVAALATYFLAHGMMMWMAVAGGAGAVVSGFVTYVILRCALGKIPEEIRAATAERVQVNNGPDTVVGITPEEAKILASSEKLPENTNLVPAEGVAIRSNDELPYIKGTVYIRSATSGPIRKDRRFEFAKRLKTEDQKPICIKEKDNYLELDGKFEKGFFKGDKNFLCRDREGFTTVYIYLPSSLFEGINKGKIEGQTIRFFYDNKLIELTCKQANNPDPKLRGNFEDILERINRTVQYTHSQGLWDEDLDCEEFMGEAVGQTLVQLNSSDNSKMPIKDFQIYKDDQEAHGSYQKLEVKSKWSDCIIFNIQRDYISLSDIVLVESTGFNELRQLWILIPHKPEKNQYEKGTIEMTCVYGKDRKQTFNALSPFRPKQGHRDALYHYGQYFMCPLGDSKSAHLSFDAAGWLRLTKET